MLRKKFEVNRKELECQLHYVWNAPYRRFFKDEKYVKAYADAFKRVRDEADKLFASDSGVAKSLLVERSCVG